MARLAHRAADREVPVVSPHAAQEHPEGRSVIRNCYRSYYMVKRLDELEAILFERMAGFPVL